MSLPPLYYCDDKLSFAYDTVRVRWPKIIDGAVSDASAISDDSKRGVFIENLKKLKNDLESDAVVNAFTEDEVSLVPELATYNSTLSSLDAEKKLTWKSGPWLYLECYFYHLINLWIKQLDLSIDIFESLKTKTFHQSESGVLELCKHYAFLDLKNQSVPEDVKKLLFYEFAEISLWGNATDLSLLAGNITLDDIKSLQGAEIRKQNEKNILVNDLDSVWSDLKSDSNRIDIVLDNSGFELFTDLILSLVVLDTKLANTVYLHCKEIPWFVSDTLPKDVDLLLSQLVDSSFYENMHSSNVKEIKLVHDKIQSYVSSGQIVITSDPFWTLDLNFWSIPKQSLLFNNLLKSDLVIFKGDLNYRKLTGDLQWEKTTSFNEAIQDLANSNLKVLSLRTCKADVVVGLPKGVNEKLIQTYKSMGNEVGEFWSSSGKWAVISYSNGKNN